MPNPQITKTRTTVFSVSQIALDFLSFDEKYRKIRGNYRYKGSECYSCGKHFQDGEMISLAFSDKGNKIVCQECGIKFKNELEGK